LNPQNLKSGNKVDRGELLHDEADDVSESGGSLCTESSWDPEENDPLELEIERDEHVEQQN
jgi:hypothetical protein